MSRSLCSLIRTNLALWGKTSAALLLTFGLLPVTALAEMLYVGDWATHAIWKVAPDGSKEVFATGLTPYGMGFNRGGDLFVASGAGITKFTLCCVATPFAVDDGALDVACDSQGNVYEANATTGTVYRYTPGGVQSVFTSAVDRPNAVVVDTNDNVFVIDQGTATIYKITSGGNQSVFVSDPGLGHLEGGAFDSQGNLFVVDNIGQNIWKITPEGIVSRDRGGAFGLWNIAIDRDGSLYLANHSTGLLKWGNTGRPQVFSTGISEPADLAFSPIPEPSTLVLLGAAAVGLLGYKWRRRHIEA